MTGAQTSSVTVSPTSDKYANKSLALNTDIVFMWSGTNEQGSLNGWAVTTGDEVAFQMSVMEPDQQVTFLKDGSIRLRAHKNNNPDEGYENVYFTVGKTTNPTFPKYKLQQLATTNKKQNAMKFVYHLVPQTTMQAMYDLAKSKGYNFNQDMSGVKVDDYVAFFLQQQEETGDGQYVYNYSGNFPSLMEDAAWNQYDKPQKLQIWLKKSLSSHNSEDGSSGVTTDWIIGGATVLCIFVIAAVVWYRRNRSGGEVTRMEHIELR